MVRERNQISYVEYGSPLICSFSQVLGRFITIWGRVPPFPQEKLPLESPIESFGLMDTHGELKIN